MASGPYRTYNHHGHAALHPGQMCGQSHFWINEKLQCGSLEQAEKEQGGACKDQGSLISRQDYSFLHPDAPNRRLRRIAFRPEPDLLRYSTIGGVPKNSHPQHVGWRFRKATIHHAFSGSLSED